MSWIVILEGYSDANGIIDSDETKFTSRYVFILEGGAITRRPAWQIVIVRSIMK